jgi:hypothetical protein
MANFGFKQINNPTPASLNRWVRVVTVTIGVFLLWMPSAPAGWFNQATQDALVSVLALITALINGLAPLFGVEVTGSVPAEQVAAIDEPQKN